MSIVPPKWVKVENLGNHAIFVSFDQRNPAFCCTDPERWGGKSNCIYVATQSKKNELWSSLVRQCLVEIGGLLCILMLIPMAFSVDQITFGCFLVWFMMLGCEHLWISWSFVKPFQISVTDLLVKSFCCNISLTWHAMFSCSNKLNVL